MVTARMGSLVLAAMLMCGASIARAQDGTSRAREHYERGVGLFDEGQFAAALAEFEAAYAIEPRPALLFNIGQMHARLGHAVESADALERYVREMGDTLPAERRALVETELTTQRGRIGQVTVEVDVEGAVVSLDEVDRGRTPLPGPLRAGAGEHVLVVAADGHETSRQRFRLAGGEERTLQIDLVRLGPGGPATTSSGAPFPTLTVVGATVAGAGLVTFAVGGLVTLLEHSALTAPGTGCSPGCSSAQTSTIATTRIVADVGLGVLVVGGVLTIVGAVLELGSSGENERPAVSLGGHGFEVWW